MIKKLWNGIKKANPWLIGASAVIAMLGENYPLTIVCLMLLCLDALGDIRAELRGKA